MHSSNKTQRAHTHKCNVSGGLQRNHSGVFVWFLLHRWCWLQKVRYGHHAGAGPVEVQRGQLFPLVCVRIELLNGLQVLVAIVAANRDQTAAQQGNADRIAANTQRGDLRRTWNMYLGLNTSANDCHTRPAYQCPRIRARIVALHRFRSQHRRIAGRTIVSAQRVQIAVGDAHADAAASLVHRCAHRPFVGVRIEHLHRAMAYAAVATADHKEAAGHDGDAGRRAHRRHGGHVAPGARQRIPAGVAKFKICQDLRNYEGNQLRIPLTVRLCSGSSNRRDRRPRTVAPPAPPRPDRAGASPSDPACSTPWCSGPNCPPA